MVVYQDTKEKVSAALSIPQIRMIELIAIFTIVYMAKEIAGFTYRAELIIIVFLGAAFLNLLAAGLENIFLRRAQWASLRKYTWEWITIFIDLSTVVALIYLTGTIESPFVFLVVIPLFFASRLLPAMTASLSVTAVTVAAFALLGLLEINGIIPHLSCYPDGSRIQLDLHYLVGTVLLLGGFMCLMCYLFNTFYENFNIYLKSAEDRLMSSRRRILELTRLYDISLGINSVISLETLLKMVCKEITLLLRRPWTQVILLNHKNKIVKHVELSEQGVVSLDIDKELDEDPMIKKVVGYDDGIAIEDVEKSEVCSHSMLLAGRHLRTLLAVPIISGRDNLGILMVGDRVPESFSHEDVRLLTILSSQVATAIEKSRLYEVMNGRIRRLESDNEKLNSANKLKVSYMSHLSHELKTPLTSIKAYVESIKDHIDDPNFLERKEFLSVISNETDRLIRMVNKVLDISKIEFGHRTLRRRVFKLNTLIGDVESSLQPYLHEKDLRLVLRLPPELPMIDGDEDLIKQVFINLLSNAVKFSTGGSGIFIDAVEDAVSVKVTIRDEGVGIPEEDLDDIFKQFYQVRSGQHEGAGLGLSIVKNIIEQHGGYIHASSEVGKGSAFTFTLPKEHHFNDLLGYIFDSLDAREEFQDMFQLAVKVIAEVLSVKIVSLMLLDHEKEELFIKVAYGLDEDIVEKARVRLGTGIAGMVVESGEPLLIENVDDSGIVETSNSTHYETKSLISVPLKVGATVIGVINANNKTDSKPFIKDDLNLLTSLSMRLSKVIERMRTAEDSHAFLRETIQSLRSLLESREKDSGDLMQRLVQWSVAVARKIGLGEKEIRVIQYVSSVHDVGMTCISNHILEKTLELTPEEVEEIRKHPQKGAAIMRPFEFVELVSQNILFHHERIDGNGYPMGLKGDQIPIGSRILAVLDAYVSMISEKPYRKRLTPQEAVDELVRHSGTQFDPNVVSAFVEVLMDEGHLEVEEFTRIADGLRSGNKYHIMP